MQWEAGMLSISALVVFRLENPCWNFSFFFSKVGTFPCEFLFVLLSKIYQAPIYCIFRSDANQLNIITGFQYIAESLCLAFFRANKNQFGQRVCVFFCCVMRATHKHTVFCLL